MLKSSLKYNTMTRSMKEEAKEAAQIMSRICSAKKDVCVNTSVGYAEASPASLTSFVNWLGEVDALYHLRQTFDAPANAYGYWFSQDAAALITKHGDKLEGLMEIRRQDKKHEHKKQ